MNGRCLLDTNIIIALFADEPAVKNNLIKADEVFIPSIAIGELYFGAWKSRGWPIMPLPKPVGLLTFDFLTFDFRLML